MVKLINYKFLKNLQPLQYVAVMIGLLHIGSLMFSLIFYSDANAGLSKAFTSKEDTDSIDVQKAQVVLNNFKRTEFKEGIKKWDIDARKARYLSGSNILLLDLPIVSITRDHNEPPTLVNAKSARLSMVEGNIKTAFLEGDVRIELSPDLILNSSIAEYRQDDSRLVTPERVNIKGKGYSIVADRMDLLIETSIVNLYGNIDSYFDPSSRKPGFKSLKNNP